MRGNPFVFCNISKAYKVYDINLSLRTKEGGELRQRAGGT